MHGCQATLSRTPFSDHLSLRALFPRLPAVESGSTEPIHCFTPIQNLVALALSGHTSSLTLLPLFLAPAVMSPCSPAREMPLCPFPQKSKKKKKKKVKITQRGVGHSHGNQVLWYRQGYQAKPNAICIQIAQLAPCCYDNGTQLPEFIWK